MEHDNKLNEMACLHQPPLFLCTLCYLVQVYCAKSLSMRRELNTVVVRGLDSLIMGIILPLQTTSRWLVWVFILF